MRESLKKSVEHSPVAGFEKYPKDSIVLCNACGLPIFKLDRSIALGDKAGHAASAFKPLAATDIGRLADRPDIDAGVRSRLREQTVVERMAHVAALKEVRTGDPMLCPVCKTCFVQVVSVEKDEVLERSYTVELLTIPPKGYGRPAPVRGKRLGANEEWLQ